MVCVSFTSEIGRVVKRCVSTMHIKKIKFKKIEKIAKFQCFSKMKFYFGSELD